MAGYRFNLDLFVPETVFNKIPLDRKQDFRDEVRALKALAVKVGDEMTVKATWHKCFHDEKPPRPCEPEQDI